jgi:TRAP-type transport system small permease protein
LPYSLVIERHRHLKWRALDPLENVLMMLCGLSIIGFTASVFLDVLTREIRYPFLWLQLVTTGFFGWGVFIGMATATRRLDHLNLVEITKRMRGPKRTFFEVFNRLVVLAVGLCMLVFGIQNFFNDLGSYRAPSLIPLRRACRSPARSSRCSPSSNWSTAGVTVSRDRRTPTTTWVS